MTPERWKRIDELFAEALNCAPEARSKLLAKACAGDDELRREVESLLNAFDQASTHLPAPGANAGARLLLGKDGEALRETRLRPELSGESATSPSAESAPGRQLKRGAAVDRYLVLDLIGRGGMGVVYSAYDPQLDRKVAVKLLRPDAFGNARASEGRAQLLQEAQALARLSHPNVISVFDVGTFEEQVFIAMEYIDGSTLKRWLKEGERSWRGVLEVSIQAGRGLAAAHAAGLIHRDFKPDNVLVGFDGRVRVLDFGLARAAPGPGGDLGRRVTLPNNATPSGSGPTATTHLTSSGLVAGTPAYMSPEAVRGDALDERSDVFSFAVTAWEALYGELPFAGETAREVSIAAERGEVRPVPARRRAPKVLGEVLRRGLEASPKDRFATVQELLTALEKAARRGRRRLLGTSAGLFVAAALTGLFWISTRSQPTALDPPRFHRMTDSGGDHSPAASPDGRTLVFTSNRDGQPRIWLRDLAEGRELALTSGPDERARLSPDGSKVLFVRDLGTRSALYSALLSAAAPREIVDHASDGDFSPDGHRVACIRNDSVTGTATKIEIVPAEGGEAREIFRLPPGSGGLDSPRWSPDGSMIAARQAAASTGVPDSILLVRTDGTGNRSIRPPGPPGRISALTFSGSGSALIYAQSESLSSTRAHVSSRMVRLDLSTLQANTLFWVPERVQAVALAGSGRLVFDAHSSLENLRESFIGEGESGPAAPGGEARWLTRGRSNDRQPVYSPDSEWVAFSSDRSGNLDLWKVSTKTGALRQLTHDAADDWDPAFTRDGKQLLWSSNRTGSFEIWIAAADGDGARQLTHDGLDAENPTATPDGQWIVYSSGNPAHPGIWKIRADGRQATQLVAGTAVWPEVSPDGKYVVYRNAAYDWPDSQVRDISLRVAQIADGLVVPFEIELRNGLSAGRARWLPDGRRLAFIGSTENGINGVFVQEFTAGGDTRSTRHRLAGFASKGTAESFAISPDGNRVTLAETEALSSLIVADGPGLSAAR